MTEQGPQGGNAPGGGVPDQTSGWQSPPSGPRPGWQMPAPAPAPRRDGFSWSDFFSFRFMITPVLIEVIYGIGIVVITLIAFAIAIGASSAGSSAAGGVLGGLLFFAVAQLVFRVYMEVVIVLFRIHGSLESIDRRGREM